MRTRKFSPVDRENPIFEVCDNSGDIVYFDVSVSDAGSLEIAFHRAISDQVMLASDFERALDEAKRRALADRISN
jgi:hypothetical protein